MMCFVDHQIDFFAIQPFIQLVQAAYKAILACKNDIISLLDMYELVVHTRNNAVAEHGAVYHIVRICIACKSLCCLLQKQMAVCYPKDFLALIHSVPEQPMCCC